jgi:hypothetical protein
MKKKVIPQVNLSEKNPPFTVFTQNLKDFFIRNKAQVKILAISLLFSFVLVEVVLHVLHYPYLECPTGPVDIEESMFGHYDAMTGWSYDEFVSHYRDGVVYHLGEWGVRSDNPLRKIDYSKPRILFIGDSITFGYGLNYEETFAAKIGKLLGDKFEVVNLGVQGYGTDQALIRMRQYIGTIKPSIIVYTHIPDHLERNINSDRSQLFKCLRFKGTKPLFTVTKSSKDNGLKQIRSPEEVDEHSLFKTPLFVENQFDRLRMSIWKKSGKDTVLTKALLKQISDEGSNFGSVFFIYYDTYYDPRPDSYNEKSVKKIFTDQNLKVLPVFNFASDPKGDYFVSVSHYHPNGKVTSIIADEFYKKFGAEINSVLNENKH